MEQHSTRGFLEVVLDAMKNSDNKSENNDAFEELETGCLDVEHFDVVDKYIEVKNACIILGESTIADTQAIRNFFSTISNARLDILKVTEPCMAHEYDIAFILCANNGDLNALAAVVSDLRTINCHGIVTVLDTDRPGNGVDYGDLVYSLKDFITHKERLINQGSTAEEVLINIVGCVSNIFAGHDKLSNAVTDRIDFYPLKMFSSCNSVDILKCEGNYKQQTITSIIADICNVLEEYGQRVSRAYIHMLGNCDLSFPEVTAVTDEVEKCINKDVQYICNFHIDSKPKGYIKVTVVVGLE